MNKRKHIIYIAAILVLFNLLLYSSSTYAEGRLKERIKNRIQSRRENGKEKNKDRTVMTFPPSVDYLLSL